MNTFTVPRWVQVEGSRMLLRMMPIAARLEPKLTDDQAIEMALAVARAINTTEEEN